MAFLALSSGRESGIGIPDVDLIDLFYRCETIVYEFHVYT